ncbi:MAG: helix-turn-helix transcriptional regulator [Lentisphaeria bacterium]|nr:helix-turn-helix transcriptional regulator [Lentisphaeria bacterium]
MKKTNFLYRRDDFFRNGGHVIEDFYVNLTGAGDEKVCFHLKMYLESEWRDFCNKIPPQPGGTVFIGLILSGKQYRSGESGSRILEAGDVLIDRIRNEELAISSLPGNTLRRIGVEITGNPLFEVFCGTLFPAHVTVIKCREPEKVKSIMESIRNEININGGRGGEISALIFILMQELASQYSRYDFPEPLQKALDLIEKNGFQTLSREELAAQSGVSIRKLTALFQQYLGTSPGRYMSKRRLEHAAGLLKTNRFSVKECARLSGFGSVEFFIREFKKFTGVTPGRF